MYACMAASPSEAQKLQWLDIKSEVTWLPYYAAQEKMVARALASTL
jgi:polyphosphate kinase 2 (PPK2 family)